MDVYKEYWNRLLDDANRKERELYGVDEYGDYIEDEGIDLPEDKEEEDI